MPDTNTIYTPEPYRPEDYRPAQLEAVRKIASALRAHKFYLFLPPHV